MVGSLVSDGESVAGMSINVNTENAVTQLIPVLRAEPMVIDVPTVRAVARRVPSALPALGGAPREVPASAQQTINRRRRATAQTGGALDTHPTDEGVTVDEAVDENAAADEDEAVDQHAAADEDGAVDERAVDDDEIDGDNVDDGAAGPVGTAVDDADPGSMVEPPVPTSTVGESMDATPMDGESMDAVPGDRTTMGSGPADGQLAGSSGSAEEPVWPLWSDPGVDLPPVGDRSQTRADSTAVSVEASGDLTESVETLRDEMLRDEMLREQEHTRVGLADPASTDEAGTGGDLAVRGPGAIWSGELTRPGPRVLEADSWETQPTDSRSDSYHGRRRADASRRRRLMALTMAVATAGVVIAVSLAVRSGSDEVTLPLMTDDPDRGWAGSTTSPVATSATTTSTAASVAPSTNPLVSPGGEPLPTGSTPATNSPPVAFGPLTIEAEAALRSGGARVLNGPDCAQDAAVVSRIGQWKVNTSGVLTFTVNVPAAGSYQMTVHYLVTSEVPSRKAEIRVNGANLGLVTFLDSERSASPAGCIDPQPAIQVQLRAGANTIVFTNQSDWAPMIDKIVIGSGG